MAEADSGGMGARAAEYVDRAFQEQQRSLFDEHRRQEQRELARRKAELSAFSRQNETVEQRYAERTRRIEQGRERVRQNLVRQHGSLAGRLQGMTKAGRARQQDQLERLTDRAEALHARAYNQYSGSCERLMHNEQKARIGHARELKILREQHGQDRQHHAQRHQQSRGRQVEDRTQTLRQVAEQQLRQALKHDQQERQGRSRTG